MKRQNSITIFLFLLVFTSLSTAILTATDFPTFTDITAISGFKINNRGYSASWGDFNNDELVDLYICNTHSQPNVLYQNVGNGRFKDVSVKAGVRGHEHSLFAWWLDLDSNGYQDLFVVNLGYDNKYYLNNGDGTFNEMFDSLGISKGIPAWIDMSHDGYLDVYVGRGDKKFSNRTTSHNHFFLNLGNIRFKDFSKETFLISDYYANWPNWHDYNNDNFPDLFTINARKGNCYLYRYNSDGTFTNYFRESTVKNINGTNYWADLDGDGDQDYIIIETMRANCAIYENQNGAIFLPRKSPFNLQNGLQEFVDANQILDIDNDGLVDLQISIHKSQSQFDHFIELYQNLGNFQFEKVVNAIPLGKSWDVRNLNWADIDNDGDWDCIATLRDQLRLFRNNGNSNNYTKVALKGNDSHLDGIGATITIFTNKGRFKHWVGMGMEYHWRIGTQNTIGIGKADSIKKIKILWPSGIEQDTLNVPVNQTIRLTEPANKWFTDQTERAQLGNEMTKTMGGACADYDNDGDIDIYLANNNGPSTLFENQGSAIFSDVSITSRISQGATHLGALFFDFDNDGFKDFFVTGWYFHPNAFYKNNGNKTFANYSMEVGLTDENDSTLSLVAADFDNDGYLDLYQGQDGANVLLRNSSEGSFIDYSMTSGTTDNYIAHGMAVFDYDNDGDQDIYIANSRGGEDHYEIKSWPNVLYQNNGDATFKNVTDSVGVGCAANSKGVCVGDYDNDGDFDLYVANDDSANVLFRNNGNGTFSDVTSLAGVAKPAGAHGCQFVDFDNDGDLDLYVSGSSYIPEKHNHSMQKDHPNVLYRNNGDGTFRNITRYSGIEGNIEQTPHILVADFNNDGYPDVHAGNAIRPRQKNARNNFFQNRCRGNNYLHLKLTGTKSNRDAIGARIHVKAGDLSMWRYINYGYGFGASHSEIAYFGLGKNSRIDSVTIFWPSGIKQILTEQIYCNQLNYIEEPFQWGPIQLSRDEMQMAYTLSGIAFLIVASFLIFIFIGPIVKKGISVQRQEKATIKLQKSGLLEAPIFKVRLDLMPYKTDYLFIHSVEPGNLAAYDTNAFQWGRQETTPFIFKKDKILALRNRFGAILNQYLEDLQNHNPPNPKIREDLIEACSMIYAYLGLNGFFDKLFNHEKIENAQLNFHVDNALIPWHLAYNETRNEFLCERFSYSYLFNSLKELHKPASLFSAEALKKSLGSKAIITLFGSWSNHERQLFEVPVEIKNLSRLFSINKIETRKVDANVDLFLSTIHSLIEENKDLRIIHYSGHIDHNLLALGPNETFDPAQLEKTFGIHFQSSPIIFLNGCQTSEFWQEEDKVATNFLNAGAAACIITHARLPEKPARRFAVRFYEYFIEHHLTVAEALRRARLAVGTDKQQKDIMKYIYDLYGNPSTKF